MTSNIIKQEKAWKSIVKQYADEREENSFNSLLLDELVETWSLKLEGTSVLDVGSGIGTYSRMFSKNGFFVTAVEPNIDMQQVHINWVGKKNHNKPPKIYSSLDDVNGVYDVILIMNVLDHIRDIKSFMHNIMEHTSSGTRILISLPHPIKDLGCWNKEKNKDESYLYNHFEVNGYFEEGKCEKVRENSQGEVIVKSVTSYHRTTQTYFELLRSCKLQVLQLLEPKPPTIAKNTHSTLFTKSSKLPYFLVFDCIV